MGLKMFTAMNGLPNDVNRSGAVSPAPRATARSAPVMMPLMPGGKDHLA